MVFSSRLSKGKQTAQLNVEEAYNLWDLTTAKYDMVGRLQMAISFAHDPDLKKVLEKYLAEEQEHVNLLERELKKYSISGPDRPKKYAGTASNPEVIEDENIGKSIILMMQEDIELLLRAARTSVSNDSIRNLFISFAIKAIDSLDSTIKYIKLRGWINTPPMYLKIPVNMDESLDTGEVFHLWDHLTFRYDNIQQTQYWYETAKDGDFKYLLKKGLQDHLQKQANLLEQEINKFGIPLPNQPPATVSVAMEPTKIPDEFMFRMLYTGIIGATWLHALALKQCMTNDRIRTIFKNLLLDEIEIMDKLIKFGKVKGWLNPVPQYTPQL